MQILSQEELSRMPIEEVHASWREIDQIISNSQTAWYYLHEDWEECGMTKELAQQDNM